MAVVTRTIIAAGGGNYTTITAWEAATNLNSGADIWKGVETGGASYDETFTIGTGGDGTSTSSYVWLTVDPDDAHAGVYSTSKARLVYDAGASAAIYVDSAYCRIDWWQLYRPTSGTVGSSDEGIRVEIGSDNFLLDYLLIWCDDSTAKQVGILLEEGTIDPGAISNCVLYGWTRACIHSQQYAAAGEHHSINIDHCSLGPGGDVSVPSAPLLFEQEGGTAGNKSIYDVYNTWFCSLGKPDIRTEVPTAGDVIDLNGTNNAWDDDLLTGGSGTINENWTSNQAATDELTETAPATAGIYITDFDIATADLTLVDHANNVCITNGTDRQGSEPDSRQDFSVAVNGARGTTDVDIGAFQVSAGATGATATPAVIAAVAALPAAGAGVTEPATVIASTAALPAAGAGVTEPATVISTVTALPQNVQHVGAGPAVIASIAALPAAGVGVTEPATVIATTAALPQNLQNVGAGPAVIAAVAALPTVTSAGEAGGATPTPSVIATTAALPQLGVGVTEPASVITTTAALPAAGVGVTEPATVIAATAALPQNLQNVGAGPSTVAAIAALPTVTSAGEPTNDATATPAVTATTAALPQLGVGVTEPATVIAATVALPQALQNIGAGPAVIATTVALPQNLVSVGAAPAVIAITTTLPLIESAGEVVAGPHPITLTIRDSGHTATIHATSTATVRE